MRKAAKKKEEKEKVKKVEKENLLSTAEVLKAYFPS